MLEGSNMKKASICLATPATNEKKGRILYIDGLRGILASLVVINHVVCCFYPWYFYIDKARTTI